MTEPLNADEEAEARAFLGGKGLAALLGTLVAVESPRLQWIAEAAVAARLLATLDAERAGRLRGSSVDESMSVGSVDAPRDRRGRHRPMPIPPPPPFPSTSFPERIVVLRWPNSGLSAREDWAAVPPGAEGSAYERPDIARRNTLYEAARWLATYGGERWAGIGLTMLHELIGTDAETTKENGNGG